MTLITLTVLLLSNCEIRVKQVSARVDDYAGGWDDYTFADMHYKIYKCKTQLNNGGSGGISGIGVINITKDSLEYEKLKPDMIVSHDCPNFVLPHLRDDGDRMYGTGTRCTLDAMYNIHKPKLHIFGHHHKSFRKVIDGTEFIGLNELETIEI